MRVPSGFTVASTALAVAVAATVALASGVASFTAAGAVRVTAPKSGAEYTGATAQSRRLALGISGRSIEYVAFRFDCQSGYANTALQDIRLAKTSKGYTFKINAHSLVTYGRERRIDENAPVFVEGRFSRTARTVSGRFRVRAPGCDTGYVKWRAHR